VSDRWQRTLRQNYGIDAPKVLNSVNTRRFSPQPSGQEATLKQRYGLSGSPLYLTVGGIEPRKNSIRLLQSFAQVQQYETLLKSRHPTRHPK
jgi:glycosyltransferase involved in cell wall biosynthesis